MKHFTFCCVLRVSKSVTSAVFGHLNRRTLHRSVPCIAKSGNQKPFYHKKIRHMLERMADPEIEKFLLPLRQQVKEQVLIYILNHNISSF